MLSQALGNSAKHCGALSSSAKLRKRLCEVTLSSFFRPFVPRLSLTQGNFEETVDILLPLRYHVQAIGGSKAQQDVVNITLIDAALRLPDQVRTKK